MKLLRVFASLAVLLLFGGMASEANAHATWKHFGADKAYATREEAVADTPRVLREAGWPETVIKLMAQKMKSPGTPAHVDNGQTLDFMRSGAKAIWRNVLVDFDKPPVTDKMDYSAPSEEWSVVWGGTTWTVGIPEICRNVYGRRKHLPPPITVTRVITPSCVEVHLQVPAGMPGLQKHSRSVRSTLLRREPVKSFNCWGVIAGQYREGAPRNCDWCVWVQDGLLEMQRRYGTRTDGVLEFSFFNTSLYDVPEDVQVNADGTLDVTLVFPLEAAKEGVAVCIEVDGVIYHAYLIYPESWKGKSSYQIPVGWFESHPPG